MAQRVRIRMDTPSGNCEVCRSDRCAASVHPAGPDSVVRIQCKERKLLQFLSRIAAAHTLSRDHFEEARKHFSDRELVEIVAVRGLYYTVAMLAAVFLLESAFQWN